MIPCRKGRGRTRSPRYPQDPGRHASRSFLQITQELKGASHEIEMGRIWYQKKELEKIEVRVSVDAHARSYERFSCISGVYLAFELDSNPSEDRQQIH